jgi:hypothetical protein
MTCFQVICSTYSLQNCLAEQYGRLTTKSEPEVHPDLHNFSKRVTCLIAAVSATLGLYD